MNKIKIKREDGLTRNQIWGILKYLFAEFFTKKSKTDQGRATRVNGTLGQKMGYDTCYNPKYVKLSKRPFQRRITVYKLIHFKLYNPNCVNTKI